MNPIAARVQAMAERVMNRVRARRWNAYRALFLAEGGRPLPGSAADIVLADLRDFCRARETTFDADPRTHALLEGRREVWLRIANALALDEWQVAAMDKSRDQLLEDVTDE